MFPCIPRILPNDCIRHDQTQEDLPHGPQQLAHAVRQEYTICSPKQMELKTFVLLIL